jgi:hypothetical protein
VKTVVPNGALRTNKVLMYTGVIHPWSRPTNYSYKNQYLIYIKRIKNVTPLHLHTRLFKRFRKGERGRLESRGVYNLICRSLFYYYSDLLYYSTMFPSKRGGGEGEGEGDSERETDRERGREIVRERGIERGGGRGRGG